MRYISLFSGIEAASVAWEQLGWQPVAFSEIEPFPCAVLAHRWPDVPNLGDITQIDWEKVKETHGTIDLIIGGSPCQSFSIAGGRESLAGESRLMFEYIRAIQDIRPTWLLWENVPGVFSTPDNAFGQLLDELEKLGYGLAWRTLDAQFFGVAQRRRRVFLVGHLGDGGGAAAVLFDADSVRGNTKASREKRQELTRAAGGSATCGSFALNRQIIPNGSTAQGPVETFEVCPTLDTSSQPHGVVAANRTIAIQGDGSTSLSGNGGGYQTDGSAYTLSTIDRHSVCCVADNTSNAAIDEDMTGTLKVGGGTPWVVI